MHAKSLQSYPTLCNPKDCSPPGSSVLGILQTRTLEWITMPSSKGSSWSRDWNCISYVFCIGRQVLYHLGNPKACLEGINSLSFCLSGKVFILFHCWRITLPDRAFLVSTFFSLSELWIYHPTLSWPVRVLPRKYNESSFVDYNLLFTCCL